MAEFPIIKNVNIDGREIPFTYPQHKGSEGYVETGVDNPLPVMDGSVTQAVEALKAVIEAQTSNVVIDNFPSIQDVKVTNQQTEIAVNNLPETQKVEVTNRSEAPTDYPDLAVRTELESIKATQQAILARLDSPIDTQLTGSNVEEEYNGKQVINTRTMGLAWKAFDMFDGQVTIPSGSYAQRSSAAVLVNGFTSLGITVRDTRASGRDKMELNIYWQGISGSLATQRAVNEVITYDATDSPSVGISVSTPTKSEYVTFRLFNKNGEEREFYAKGLLRA